MFHLVGPPSDRLVWVLNGDYVDRGAWGAEELAYLCLLKLAHPKVNARAAPSSQPIALGVEKENERHFSHSSFLCYFDFFQSSLLMQCFEKPTEEKEKKI